MRKLASIHGAVAMAMHEVEGPGRFTVDGRPCSVCQVGLRMEDGTVWILDRVFVPEGGCELTLKSAAWSLEREQTVRARNRFWRRVHRTSQEAGSGG